MAHSKSAVSKVVAVLGIPVVVFGAIKMANFDNENRQRKQDAAHAQAMEYAGIYEVAKVVVSTSTGGWNPEPPQCILGLKNRLRTLSGVWYDPQTHFSACVALQVGDQVTLVYKPSDSQYYWDSLQITLP